MSTLPLLRVEGLVVDYGRGRHKFRAVDNISLRIDANETLGLVGESGSGKTTIGRVLVGLASPTAGSVWFEGEDITRATRSSRRRLARSIQIVFQDPYSSLNPAKSIGDTLMEPFLAHGAGRRTQRNELVREMLDRVGLPASAVNRFPSQFSGGERQRIAIARALMLRPKLVVCDEPVSSLDLSIQAQILNLLSDLQRDLGVSYLFIAHNLAVVRHLASRVLILYRGQVMESGRTEAVYNNPSHPYTRALISSAPVPDPELQRQLRAERAALTTVPPVAVLSGAQDGCVFAGRCPYAVDSCLPSRPPLVEAPNGGAAACIRLSELPPIGGINRQVHAHWSES